MRFTGRSSPARMMLVAAATFTLSASVCVSASASQTSLPGATGPYCAIDLSAHKKACFTTEQGLTTYSSTLTTLPLVSVYNWVNYNTGGAYTIWYGDHACTTATDDVDYVFPDLTGVKYQSNNPTGISENNTYSSVSTYVAQHCDIKLFDGTKYTGSSSPWIDRCTDLTGSGTGDCPTTNWFDRASSYQLS